MHRATFCNHFISAGEAAYAISIGFKEFQLLDYGDRGLSFDRIVYRPSTSAREPSPD